MIVIVRLPEHKTWNRLTYFLDLSVLPLSDVQAAMDALSTSSERPSTLTPKHPLMKLPGTPHIIRFALNDENFIVGFIEGPVLVYSTNDLINASQTQVCS